MAYGKDENDTALDSNGDEESDGPQGLDPEDFDVPDIDEAALERATQDRPLPKGRQRVAVLSAALAATKSGDNEGRPQFVFALGLADASDGEYDTSYLRIFPPWDRHGDADGDVSKMHFPTRAAKDLRAFQEKAGVKILGRNAADVLAESPGVEFDAIIKHRTWQGTKQAEIERFC